MEDYGFVSEIKSKGMIDIHNTLARSHGRECLREGDRIVQVNGREPPKEDELCNVMPYLRLALAGDSSWLSLRVRRGEAPPHASTRKGATAPASRNAPANFYVVSRMSAKDAPQARSGVARWWSDQKSFAFSCLPILTKPAVVRSMKASLTRGRKSSFSEERKADEDASTPSTKVSSKSPSTDALPSPGCSRRPSLHVEARDQAMFPDGGLTLPGVARRVA
jgi:hypothetical protein